MVSVERTFEVARPVGVVVDYLKDFAHAEQWDPGTVSCVRTGAAPDAPVVVGSRWRNTSKVKGRETELDYELTRLEAGHLQFVGRNKTATSTDDITLRPNATGCTITYRADIVFHGLAKLAGPFLQGEFERLGDETRDTLVEVLNRLPG